MAAQLTIGALVISGTTVIVVLFIAFAERVLTRLDGWLERPPFFLRSVVVLVAVTLWLVAAMSLGVWLWATAFLAVGVFDTLEPAVYFSVVAFTTLGFGDVLVAEDWRLLSGISAANGLLIFGICTAFQVEVLRRLRRIGDSSGD